MHVGRIAPKENASTVKRLSGLFAFSLSERMVIQAAPIKRDVERHTIPQPGTNKRTLALRGRSKEQVRKTHHGRQF